MPKYQVTFYAIAKVRVSGEIDADTQEAALSELADKLDFAGAFKGGPLPPGVEHVEYADGIDCAHVRIVGDAEKMFDRYYRPDPAGDWEVLGSGEAEQIVGAAAL